MKPSKKDIRVDLVVVPHESDKRFPKAAILRLRAGDKVIQVADDLDKRYQDGDTQLELRHLSGLFRKMSEKLVTY